MINIILLVILVISATAAIRLRGLLSAAIMLSIYSLGMAALWTSLDAIDVAFTEAAVGAGVSTILLFSVLGKTGTIEKPQPWKRKVVPFLLVVLAGVGMAYGTIDMPVLGEVSNITNQHVIPRYIAGSETEAGVPNMVAAILAYYRGYDTLFETTVILTACFAVQGLLMSVKAKKGQTLLSKKS